jgi:hypothetical protein
VTVAGSFNCGTNIVIGLAIASRDIKMLSIVLPSVQIVNTSLAVAGTVLYDCGQVVGKAGSQSPAIACAAILYSKNQK